jgi:hypothetical protein
LIRENPSLRQQQELNWAALQSFRTLAGRVLEELQKQYGDKIRFVWKDLPLDFHKNALPAATAARVAFMAKGSEAFWKMNKKLFANQGTLSDENYVKWLAELGIDKATYEAEVPALRAALYQVAASLPGVEYLGPTTDRLGRHGVAVALSHGDAGHARSRDVMVFDPTTGLLLQTEERAVDPAQFGLPASMKDAVVGWEVWVRSGVVDAVGRRPDGTRADLTAPAPPARS